MRVIRSSLPVLLLIVSACAPIRSAVGVVFPGRAERLARQVTIHRDAWGVPHILGETDAAVVFGLAWAQAEDNFWQVEEDIVRSIGRAAELYGESELADDLVRAALDVQQLSRAEYEREPEDRRALWDAYAAGLNHWIDRHPEQRRLLQRFEPWHVFARFRSGTAGTRIDGVRLGNVVVERLDASGAVEASGTADELAPGTGSPADAAADEGSNAWAIAPSITAGGHALLFQNPHVGFFGGGQRYEAHLHSDEGYRVNGFAILGTPMIRSGRNERLGWTHTNTAADHADVFLLDVTADDPHVYRRGGQLDTMEVFERTLRVRVDSATTVERTWRFRRTQHGPVLRLEDGRFAAVRIARFEDGGSLQQWYAMGRAQNLDEFRDALAQTAFPISNTMYADADGNIMFVQGNAVPKRSAAFDWSAPVDGSDPATDWQGYHALEELPQLINPAGGWLQNANATPYLATADEDNLDPADYPAYMAPEPDNARARRSREILAADSSWTLDELAAAAFDRRMAEATAEVPAIADEWERLGAMDPDRAVPFDVAIDALRHWDGVATLESPATTLFVLWLERFRRQTDDTAAYPRLAALEGAMAELRAAWDTVLVPWGEVNRLQRVHTSGDLPFDDSAPSLPVAGAPGWTGIIFNVTGRPGPGGGRRYGVSGHTWVSIVEFAPEPVARSIVTFGQSAHPDSPHWFDQAPLYVQGRFKEAWFRPEDVLQQARRTYRPGHEPESGAGPD